MLKMTAALALCAAMITTMTSVSALAGSKQHRYPAPPAGYSGQWWTGPAGCTYSKAGRGGEVVWFLTNTPGKGGCPEFIVTRPIDNAYRAPNWQNG